MQLVQSPSVAEDILMIFNSARDTVYCNIKRAYDNRQDELFLISGLVHDFWLSFRMSSTELMYIRYVCMVFFSSYATDTLNASPVCSQHDTFCRSLHTR